MGLGLSDTAQYTVPYGTFHSALGIENANPAAIAGNNANGGNGVDNLVTGTGSIDIKSANGRAIGIATAAACIPTFSAAFDTNICSTGTTGAYDGVIGLNTSLTFPPNAPTWFKLRSPLRC